MSRRIKKNICRRGVKHRHWKYMLCPKCKYPGMAPYRSWLRCQCGKKFYSGSSPTIWGSRAKNEEKEIK